MFHDLLYLIAAENSASGAIVVGAAGALVKLLEGV